MQTIVISFAPYHDLAAQIADRLSVPLEIVPVILFADGEIKVNIENPARFHGKRVIIVQSTSYPVHEHIFSIAFLAYELKNAGVRHISAVVPYFSYSRQELSAMPGKAGVVAVVVSLFKQVGIEQLTTIELHAPSIIPYLSIPMHNLIIDHILVDHIRSKGINSNDTYLVAPDRGALPRIKRIAQQLHLEVIVCDKERFDVDRTRLIHITGPSTGRKAIIVDDIIDTGGTALHVCDELYKRGFEEIIGYFVHPVLSLGTTERIEQSTFKTIFVSNTIPVLGPHKKIEIFDVSAILSSVLSHSIKT